VFLGHNVNLVLPCWDGEQLKQPDAMLVTELDIAIRSIDSVTNLLQRCHQSPRVTAYNKHEVLITLTLILLNLFVTLFCILTMYGNLNFK